MLRPWAKLSSRTLFGSKVFELGMERLRSPRTEHELDAVVLRSADWVNVVALTPDDQVVMVRQYRFGIEEVTLEIPGGIVDPGESPLVGARRELREETGYDCASVTSLGSIAPNPAIHRNRLHTFLAEGCVLAAAQEQDPGEDIEVELCPLAEIDGLLASGAISHALVAVAFHKLALHRAGYKLG
jgi:8-oxo-dGTP pyrophosphatase MutT (NUDIX family)